MNKFVTVNGGVTAPRGFTAAGIHAGIKASSCATQASPEAPPRQEATEDKSKPDLALIVSGQLAVVAGTFTTNKIQSAPVKICRERLAGKKARAIVVNSGNANACTGPQGLVDAERIALVVAEQLDVDEKTVFVCSTGTIGVSLPMDKIEAGIKLVAKLLSENGGGSAAKAIMTTDTVDKQAALEISIDGVPVRVGGMAKGAGMIEPNMATMLAFLTTDAAIDPEVLQDCLSSAVTDSFNRISIDGDQSTNDTVLFMANGAAGNKPLNGKHPDLSVFSLAVNEVTRQLAMKIVEDGEGATKFVTVRVSGAALAGDARKVARAVANSLLVKTSWYGEDANWGRVINAAGYSGAEVKENLVDISYDDICAVRSGRAVPEMSVKDLKKVLAQKNFSVNIELHLGDGTDTVYTCDCSEEYVKINSEYMT